MAELYGWVGKILKVDLSSGDISSLPTSDYVPQFIGGRALAAKLYWDHVPPDCAAFDPENAVIFASGVASGVLGPGQRTAVVSKSPYTVPESYNFSVTGGQWSSELKFAGYDAVVVTGKASAPCYLWIHDGEAQILKAERLWGLTTGETDAQIRSLWGDKTRSMLIGPAGENLVKTAVVLEGSHATGLGGFGAVMGSKNLKAIAVQGTGGVKVARPKDLLDFYDEYVKIGGKYGGPYLISSPAYFVLHQLRSINKYVPEDQKAGYLEDIDTVFNEDSPWSQYLFASEEVKAGTMRRKFEGCFACPACCGMVLQAVDPTGQEEAPYNLDPPMGAFQQCVELQTQTAWEAEAFQGKLTGRANLMQVTYPNELGLTATPMIFSHGWFNAAVSQGLLTEENTGLPCGDIVAYNTPDMLGKDGYTFGITYKKNDFFEAVAEGSRRFLEAMAEESDDWKALYESNFGLPYYHMNLMGTGGGKRARDMLFEATNYRGHPNEAYYHFALLPSNPSGGKTLCGFAPQADMAAAQAANREKFAHVAGPQPYEVGDEPATWEGKVAGTIFAQNVQMEMDSIPMCGWMGFPRFYSMWTDDLLGDPSAGAKVLAAAAGIDRSMEENWKAMEAPITLERAIHAREGHRREHDVYIDAVFEKTDWTTKDEYNKALDDYYAARGWDVDTGIPTRGKLEELGMKDVADDLEKKYGVPVS
jgi:aldehyde:ferredoxin oxidoreductase